MSDETKTDGQPNPENNADGSLNKDESNKDGFVKFETYDKVMSKLKKTESLLRETNDKVSQFENERKAKEESELFEKGEYEKLLNLEKAKNQELQRIHDDHRSRSLRGRVTSGPSTAVQLGQVTFVATCANFLDTFRRL